MYDRLTVSSMPLFTTLWFTKCFTRTILELTSVVKVTLSDSESATRLINYQSGRNLLIFLRQRKQDLTKVRSGLGFYV